MLFRAVVNNRWIYAADIPADTGNQHFNAIRPRIGFVNRFIQPEKRVFIIMATHNDDFVDKPAFFTRPPTPDTHFVTVKLGVNTGCEIGHALWHPGTEVLNTFSHHLGIGTLTNFRLPRFAKRCVDESLTFPVSPLVFIQSLTICTQVVNGLYAVQT
jgi:hypothetical protein